MPQITSCSTLVYTDLGVEEALQRIASHGFKRVEFASLASYCRHFDEDETDPSKLRAMLYKLGLTPIALNYSTNRTDGYRYKLNIPEEAAIVEQKLRKVILKASEVGIPLVCTGPGQRNDSEDRRDEVEKAAELINRMAEYSKDLGVKLVLEVPHCWLLCNNLERTKEMLSLIESENIGTIMDSTHWHVIGYDIDDYIEMIGNKLCHVHLRDAAGPDTGDFKQKLEITPGKGEVDFKKFGEYLDKYHYKGDVSLEFEYRNRTADEIEIELDHGIRYLSKCGWGLPEDVRKSYNI